MLTQRHLAIRIAAFLFAFGAVVPVPSSGMPGGDRTLSEALEQALSTLVSSGDYWTASKVSFQLAQARSRMNETASACDALSRSLAYYRKSVAEEVVQKIASNRPSQDEGLQEIRSQFGCSPAQFG